MNFAVKVDFGLIDSNLSDAKYVGECTRKIYFLNRLVCLASRSILGQSPRRKIKKPRIKKGVLNVTIQRNTQLLQGL